MGKERRLEDLRRRVIEGIGVPAPAEETTTSWMNASWGIEGK